MKFYSEDEALEMVLGEKGSEARNLYEEDMSAFFMGLIKLGLDLET